MTWDPPAPVFSLSLQVVVLCFAVAFGSFFQGYGPYPSATKTALPSQQEPYTASVGKAARGVGWPQCHFSGTFRERNFLKGVLRDSLSFKTW